jgi:hypothetical protein
MPAHAVDLETKQQGNTWLLPPYSYSLRQIASELDVGIGTVQKWRQELVENGHQFENENSDSNDYSADQSLPPSKQPIPPQFSCCLYPCDILSPKSSEKYILFI